MRRSLAFALLLASFLTCLATSAAAAPGFLPPRGGDISLDADGAYFDGAFRPDSSFEILYGNDRSSAGAAYLRRHLPYTNGAGERELNFGSYGDVETLDSIDDGYAITNARIATDAAGNSVAAWSTTCEYAGPVTARCVKAALRPAGGG